MRDAGLAEVTKNKLPSLSVTYRGYKECTFGPLASRRFPLWSVHPPYENPTQMPASSSCPTEIKGLENSGTCQTLCRATRKVELYGADFDYSTMLRISDLN